MSFYDDASIVVIPSGYKTSKVYSAKPTDGTGDLTYTRTGSTATRINESGIMEKCFTNLLLNSATLVTQNVTVVAAPYTLSFYGTGTVTLSGVIVGSLVGTGASNRVSSTATATAGTLTLTVTGSVTSAQLQIGDTVTDYIPTTSAAVTVGPVANMPRLDYTGGGCPNLLMEPAATNLITYSEQFDFSGYTNTEATTVSVNVAVSPDGYTNADKFIPQATSNSHRISRSITMSLTSAHTFSVFVKKGGNDYFLIRNFDGVNANVAFNLANGTVTYESSGYPAFIKPYANGWYRVGFTRTFTNITTSFGLVSSPTPITSISLPSFVGDGVSGTFVWGIQLENNPFVTSYIRTINATVTRNIDSAVKTSATALIGQTEGTIYSEIDVSVLGGVLNRDIIFLSDGTANNSIHIGASSTLSNVITARVAVGGVVVALIDSPSISSTGTYKLAMAYKLNDIVFYINGVQIGVDTVATIPACSQLNIGSNYTPANSISDGIKSSMIFKTRLTNANLATLTTL